LTRVAVVVGASSGLGRAVALEFASRGYALVLVALADPSLDAVGAECRRVGGAVVVAPADVRDAQAMGSVAALAVEQHGAIDVWVQLAATATFGAFLDVPVEDFRRILDVNVMGYVHGARAALGVFGRQHRGVLVNVGSIVGELPVPALSPYVTSKFAVSGLGKALRADFRDEHHIHVCTVLPGAMDTPLWQTAQRIGGAQPKPPAPRYRVERVARAVVRCAERPRPEVSVGAAVKLLRIVHRLFPSLVEPVLTRYLARVMFGSTAQAGTHR
jgi:short-subunit dehydrogenase